MWKKHKHQWAVVSVNYMPPNDTVTSVKGVDREMFAQIVYGVTILTQRCTECGWTTITRRAGES